MFTAAVKVNDEIIRTDDAKVKKRNNNNKNSHTFS